jgi:hypothetical protein
MEGSLVIAEMGPAQGHMVFKVIAICFSQEKWSHHNEAQRFLYCGVTLEN